MSLHRDFYSLWGHFEPFCGLLEFVVVSSVFIEICILFVVVLDLLVVAFSLLWGV